MDLDFEINSIPEHKQIFYKALYEAYKKGLKKPLPKDNTIPSIDKYMKKELLAKEFMDRTFEGIHKDEYIRVKEIVKMYRVCNADILDSLYIPQEKIHDVAFKENVMKTARKNHLILILESKNGITVSGYTIMGYSEKFNAVINSILSRPSIAPEELDLNNEVDMHYLKSLWVAGFLEV